MLHDFVCHHFLLLYMISFRRIVTSNVLYVPVCTLGNMGGRKLGGVEMKLFQRASELMLVAREPNISHEVIGSQLGEIQAGP